MSSIERTVSMTFSVPASLHDRLLSASFQAETSPKDLLLAFLKDGLDTFETSRDAHLATQAIVDHMIEVDRRRRPMEGTG